MAETLTYDAGTDTVSTEETLSTDEQDSLQVGEELESQQESLLAGKYKDAQELEKAYVELEKKLGSESKEKTETTEEVSEPEAEKPEEDKTEATILDELWEEANTGEEYKKETLEKLSKMDPTDLANMHLKYRQENQGQPTNRDFSKQDIDQLHGIVGGEGNYKNMMQWANKSLNKQEVDMFDAVMERGDPLAAFFAVRSLAYRYNDTVGYDGQMLTGTAPKNQDNGYKSQAQLVAAMSDPRYDNDPAYRQEVIQKLERSDVSF